MICVPPPALPNILWRGGAARSFFGKPFFGLHLLYANPYLTAPFHYEHPFLQATHPSLTPISGMVLLSQTHFLSLPSQVYPFCYSISVKFPPKTLFSLTPASHDPFSHPTLKHPLLCPPYLRPQKYPPITGGTPPSPYVWGCRWWGFAFVEESEESEEEKQREET